LLGTGKSRPNFWRPGLSKDNTYIDVIKSQVTHLGQKAILRSFFFSQHRFSSPNSQYLLIACHTYSESYWSNGSFGAIGPSLYDVQTKCQPDKIPTRQNANQRLDFCQDFLLWLTFCPSQFLVVILSGPSQHVLAFWQNHEKWRHLSEYE